MPFVTPRLEVITMGKSTVVNASKSVMPYVKHRCTRGTNKIK